MEVLNFKICIPAFTQVLYAMNIFALKKLQLENKIFILLESCGELMILKSVLTNLMMDLFLEKWKY